MNRLVITSLLFQLIGLQHMMAQGIQDLTFGSDDTLEIITWNIEQFPKNGQTTVSYVIDIIEALDVDILAIQEVNDVSIFNKMVSELSSYDAYIESLWFGGLAYIYKTDSIQINSLYEIYTTSEFWNYFPRSPMVMDLNFMGEQFIVINNHFKCCGDGFLDFTNDYDEETRRYFANYLLKEYVDTNFIDKNVIVLGDLNDNLLDDNQNNVFQMILDDNNYLFADYEIASGNHSEWSFPSWPSHLDHILITDELFDDFQDIESDIQTIKVDEYLTGGWQEYDENVSDHRPVALKLLVDDGLSISETNNSKPFFINYPNPFKSETNFSFYSTTSPHIIEIYNINGQKITSLNINEGQFSVKLNAQELASGIYIAKLISNNNVITTRKLVVMK